MPSSTPPPIVELVSPPPTHAASGAGKTSLVYLITALAILPRNIMSVSLGGHEAAVVLFDPLHHFNVARLAQLAFHLVRSRTRASNPAVVDDGTANPEIKAIVKRALPHVHIFRPRTWPSLLDTLRSLPAYLFHQTATQHQSIHRRIHALILEDMDTFVPLIRSNMGTASWSSASSFPKPTNALPSASATLTFHLSNLSTLLDSAIVLTAHSTTPTHYRPALPTTWPRGSTVTRLALRRVDVLKFAAESSVEDAEAEKAKRWEVASRARFECWRVGLDARSSGGFVFRVGSAVDMERTR